MEVRYNSMQPELWHPYSRPEGTNVDQGTAGVESDLTDPSHYPRLDRVASGL